MCEQIVKILEESWKKFCDYYDTNAPEYRTICGIEPYSKQAKDAYWICWSEYDLTFHIVRFFYKILSKKEEFSNIQVHIEKKIKQKNFGGLGYVFEDKLKDLNEKLQKWPKIDMIITPENSVDPFLLCAEVKCFRGYERPIPNIEADIKDQYSKFFFITPYAEIQLDGGRLSIISSKDYTLIRIVKGEAVITRRYDNKTTKINQGYYLKVKKEGSLSVKKVHSNTRIK